MSGVQDLFLKLLPAKWANDMEADSRRWMIRCPKCGFEQSYWDMGGIRWKAVGNQRNFMRCIRCGKRSWHISYRKPDPGMVTTESPATPAMSATRSRPRWLMWPMVLVPVAGILTLIVACALSIVLLATTLVQPVVTVGDGFMTALKANNDAQAYALCAPGLKADVSNVAGLASRLEGHRPAQWGWSTRSIRNGVGRLEGSYATTNGKSGTVILILQQVDNQWRISGFQFR